MFWEFIGKFLYKTKLSSLIIHNCNLNNSPPPLHTFTECSNYFSKLNVQLIITQAKIPSISLFTQDGINSKTPTLVVLLLVVGRGIRDRRNGGRLRIRRRLEGTSVERVVQWRRRQEGRGWSMRGTAGGTITPGEVQGKVQPTGPDGTLLGHGQILHVH